MIPDSADSRWICAAKKAHLLRCAARFRINVHEYASAHRASRAWHLNLFDQPKRHFEGTFCLVASEPICGANFGFAVPCSLSFSVFARVVSVKLRK